MIRPEIVGEGYYTIRYDDETSLLLKKAPPGQEEKRLELYKVRTHSYQSFEEMVDEDTDYRDLWREAVANEDTEKGFDDWYDDNYSDIINGRACDYDPDWKMVSNDLYRWCRNNRDEVYYWGQLEEEGDYVINSYSELLTILENEGINTEDCTDEVLLEINLYFENTTYRFVP